MSHFIPIDCSLFSLVLVGEGLAQSSAGAASEGGLVHNLVGLGLGGRRVGECPGQGCLGSTAGDAVIDRVLILSIDTTVDRQVLKSKTVS